MTGKDSKTSYTDTILFIPFIKLLNFWNARWTKIIYKVQHYFYDRLPQ